MRTIAPLEVSPPPIPKWEWVVGACGLIGGLGAFLVRPAAAGLASEQSWPAFIVVSGLLLVGLAAERDGLFRALGELLARLTSRGLVLFVGSVICVTVVTATLNLDTSVVFVTPVLLAIARHRGGGETALLYASIFMANASSLFLPGSNLTNLIVLGHQHLSGLTFLSLMWPAALAAVVVAAGVLALWSRQEIRTRCQPTPGRREVPIGLGLLAVIIAVLCMLCLRNPALPVLGVGVAVTLVRLREGTLAPARVATTVSPPLLGGLFGIAVAAGTLGRAWSGPASMLSHLGATGTAVVSAGMSLLINNLPAAALLGSRPPHHAAAMLIGLNLGPNLCVTGSLAWILWLRVARAHGAAPSLAEAVRRGAVIVPLTMAAALVALAL